MVVGDRFTEGMPLCRIDGGFVEAGLCGSEAEQSECGAAEVEVTHHRVKSPALFADQMRARDEHVVEVDRTPSQRQAAHAGHVVHRDLVLIERYHVAADSGRSLGTGLTCVDQRRGRMHGPGDRGLLPRQRPSAVDRSRHGCQPSGVGARPWFGQGDRDIFPALDHRWQIALLDLLGPVHQLRADESDLHGRGGEVHISVGEGFSGKPERHRVLGAGATVLFRQPDSQDTEFAQLAEDLERKFGGSRTIPVSRKQDFAREVDKGLLKRGLIGSEIE